MHLSVATIVIFALLAVGLVAFLVFYYSKANRRDREKLEAELKLETEQKYRASEHERHHTRH